MTYKEYQETLEKIALQNLDELGVGELVYGLTDTILSLYGPIIKDIFKDKGTDNIVQTQYDIHKVLDKFTDSTVEATFMAVLVANYGAMWLAGRDNPEHTKAFKEAIDERIGKED